MSRDSRLATSRLWKAPPPGDPALVTALSERTGLSPLAATLLVNRGFDDPDDAARWLAPRLSDLPSPFLMKDMREATDRILSAIRDDEPITIWGDYDVDGVTSVSLLLLFLRELGVNARFVIPDRFGAGYGLNVPGIEECARNGTRLVIAVDCGISGHAEVERARELGVDVIVVDHHRLGDAIPNAHAVLDPLRGDCEFPFEGMAACGLVFYLLIALRSALRERGVFERMQEPDLRQYLDIVALGTIADMVPLREQNRTLAVRGLEQLARSQRPGIRALCEVARVDARLVDGGVVGFQLGPRINAVGRIGNARRAVELLTAPDIETARALAAQIDAANRKRRDIQQKIFAEVSARVEEQQGAGQAAAIVLADEGWHPGVMGIVAAKIVERYQRPTVLIAMESNGIGRGSGRSVPGFDLFDALSACSGHLEATGGHSQAAGVTIRAESVDAFRHAFLAIAAAWDGDGDGGLPELRVDGEIPLASVDRGLIAELDRLSPFGTDNPEPVFFATAVKVSTLKRIRDEHLSLTFRQEGASLPAIAFGFGHLPIERGDVVDVAFRPELERWRGRETLRLRVVDIRPSD